MRVDKIGMAHSIEARVPFLDHRLVEFIMTIPPNIKVPSKNLSKNVLKKAVEPILPHEIINRKKQGFWAPVNEWLRNEWFSYAKATITSSSLINSGIFNTKFIEQILARHKSGKSDHGLEIYTLLMLSLWHERFMK
jgi:asparagine synthase (glutamine-hydrolysing)